MSSINPKRALFIEFAGVAKCLAHAHRLELLEQLAQGERSVEILAVVLLALVMALLSKGWLQFVAVVGTTLFMLVLNFFLQDLGMFFDFFVPTVMLLGHVVLHKIYEWWKIAHHPVEAAAHV